MTAYSARLQVILVRAGFPADEPVKLVTLEQKMDQVFPAMRCNGTRLIDAINGLSRAARFDILVDWKA